MRKIDADAVMQKLKNFYGVKDGKILSADALAALSVINDAPTVEYESVGTAKWETTFGSYCTPRCTNCGWHIHYSEDSVLDARNYCPNCGAKMDGGYRDGRTEVD